MLYLLGRVIGVPAVGFISDRLVGRGISRNTLAIGFVLLTAVLFELLPMGIKSTTILGILFFLMGVSMNLYPLITAALSETFGPQKTSSVMGFLNTFAQLAGATALLLSGFLGIALNSAPGNALEEYRGIWLVGVVGCLFTASVGTVITFLVRGHYKVRTV